MMNPEKPNATLPGVSFDFRPGRPRPFTMRYRDGERQRRMSFRTAADRQRAARALADKISMHGKTVLTFDPVEWRQWLDFKARVGGADPRVVADHWLATKGAPAPTVADCVTRYLAMRVEAGLVVKSDTYRQLRLRLQRRFAADFGSLKVTEVEPEHVRGWLRNLVVDGAPAAPVTKQNHFSSVRVLFTWALSEGLVHRNPCQSVIPPEVLPEDVSVIPLPDALKLFRANRNEVCIGRLALEAFAGLRYASAARIRAEHLDFERGGIVMPGRLHKSRKRQYVSGFPPSLWEWLRHAPKECWELTQRQYLKAKSEAFTRAGVPHPHNVLRHSFATYHLAAFKSADKTAYLMQHRNTRMLYQHYNGMGAEPDGMAYFSITPASVA